MLLDSAAANIKPGIKKVQRFTARSRVSAVAPKRRLHNSSGPSFQGSERGVEAGLGQKKGRQLEARLARPPEGGISQAQPRRVRLTSPQVHSRWNCRALSRLLRRLCRYRRLSQKSVFGEPPSVLGQEARRLCPAASQREARSVFVDSLLKPVYWRELLS